jgi:3-hydroxyisobutyrate dehydrogenase-like beta-hydroxyacid dehydrogenase
MTKIAFLGTGLLGGALAEAAAKRGDHVTAWNRTIDKARALEQFGVRVAQSPADAVRGAECVHLVLKDDTVVDEVISAFRPALDTNSIIVDHTTNQPTRTAERAERLNAGGVRYIHCPVFIGPLAARQGEGTIMASGSRALFDAVHEALSRMATRVEYLGERPDLAAVFKLCGNAYIIGTSALMADVLAVGSSAGVPSGDAIRVLEFIDPAAIAKIRGRNMARRDYTPRFEVTMARKDIRLMEETADGRPLAVLPAVGIRLEQLIAQGFGSEDLAVIGKDSAS